jgi:aryl-alcohol dehydrogenase
MVQLGDPGPGSTFSIPVHETIVQSKQYIGLAEGDSNPPVFIPRLIKLYEEGKFPMNKISKTFHYSELEAAIRAMHDGSVIKPIITFA